MNWRSAVIRFSIVSGIVAGLVVAVGAVRGEAGRAPSPGLTAGVSALNQLPPEAAIGAEAARFVRSAAIATGTDVATAVARVRLLRTDLGSASREVYAFPSASGSTCFTLTRTGSSCARRPEDGTPGIHWLIGGGTSDAPSALVGIVADDVLKVRLTVDGREVPTTIANNVVFGEYADPADTAEIVVERSDGTASSEIVRLGG